MISDFRHPLGFGRRLDMRNRFNAARNALKRRDDVRKIDQGENQPGDPEQMHVGEQRQQPEDRNDFELQLLVSETLGQRMQSEEDDADAEHGCDHDERRDHRQDVGLAGRGDEPRQVVRGRWVLRCRHVKIPPRQARDRLVDLPLFRNADRRQETDAKHIPAAAQFSGRLSGVTYGSVEGSICRFRAGRSGRTSNLQPPVLETGALAS